MNRIHWARVASLALLLSGCEGDDTGNDPAELADDERADADGGRNQSPSPRPRPDQGDDDDSSPSNGGSPEPAGEPSPEPASPAEGGSGTTPNDDGSPDDDVTSEGGAGGTRPGAPVDPPRGEFPILFVAQVPVEGFTTLSSTFGNHKADMMSAPRGGDLMIRYPDGTLRNLTREAGLGSEGEQQDGDAIAVREPTVHWSGEKAIFSMVVGAPAEQYEVVEARWQMYEVSGLGTEDMAVVTKVAGQPEEYNNVSPVYATNGLDILFTSDRPITGEAHLYPQLDEYESAPTVVGIYRLSPSSGALTLLEHSPSGAFSLSIDSFGRVIFTKWDHLQRDQQAIPDYSPITFSDETAEASTTTDLTGAEVFPELRESEGNVSGHRFNHFFPWEINEDGTAEETLNHVGRHELGGSYTEGSFIDDENLSYFSPEEFHANRLYIDGDGGTIHLREHPLEPGQYYATVAPEFYTAGGGYLVKLDGPVGKPGDEMTLTAVTSRDDGHYRNPLATHDDRLIAVYAAETDTAYVDYSENTVTNYDYRLYELVKEGDVYRASAPLTTGITKRVTWWNPDVSFTWDGPLWELDPVEVVPRAAPSPRVSTLEAPERAVFDALGVDADELRAWLVENELALIVMRNVTLRDRGDIHQPFNLRVPGGVEAIAGEGTVYDVSHLQIFEARALRGYEGGRGRRLLARPMSQLPLSSEAGPEGSATIGSDGSVATLVPARRALSWQLVDPSGEPIVRERNWLSFQAGEIRGCPTCHGLNSTSQLGTGVPENEPEALRMFLQRWLDER
jgi:hypothetical protein